MSGGLVEKAIALIFRPDAFPLSVRSAHHLSISTMSVLLATRKAKPVLSIDFIVVDEYQRLMFLALGFRIEAKVDVRV